MISCSNCGRGIPKGEDTCPYCGERVPFKKIEIIENIKHYEERRKRAGATFVLGMFGMWILPFLNLFLLLAVICFGIAPSLIIYYTWKKRRAEKKLERDEGLD